jgi:hypothetical protein
MVPSSPYPNITASTKLKIFGFRNPMSQFVPSAARCMSHLAHNPTVTRASRGAYSRPSLKVGNRASIHLISSTSLSTRSNSCVWNSPGAHADFLNTQFDVSPSPAFPVQLVTKCSRAWRAMPKKIFAAAPIASNGALNENSVTDRIGRSE